MLTREAIFRQIDADQVEPIQKVVTVDYDNSLQMPLGFWHQGRYHEVIELVGSFRETPDDPAPLYLVRTRDGVYALYPDLWKNRDHPCLWRGQWVLHWRLEEGKEDTVLADMKLKRLADFHGHLCPELVIGYRAVQVAMAQIELELLWSPDLCVIVENTTSAVDAVQQITNCTLGNGRLRIRNYGKHVYTFIYGEGDGLCLTLRPEVTVLLPDILALEEKIKAGQATMLEIARYRVLLDERVLMLLAFPDLDLFSVQRVAVEWPDESTTSALVPCSVCGGLVAVSHLVTSGGRRLCRPCVVRKVAIPPEEI